MNRTHLGLAVIAFALVAAGCVPEYSRYHSRERREVRDTLALMSTQDVIALTKAKIGDRVIIEMIQNSGSEFHLRTPDVIELADSGVSDTVISAMMRSDQPGGGDGEGHGRYYGGYSPYSYYGWGVSPWWSPWYFSSYWGYWGGYYYRPHYSFHSYAPYNNGYRNRSYGVGGGGGGGGGGNRPMGGRRR